MQLVRNLFAVRSKALYDATEKQIIHNNIIYYNRGAFRQKYYGIAGMYEVTRNVFESAQGGPTFVPYEYNLKCVYNSTPFFAKNVSFKLAHMSAGTAKIDLANFGLTISRDYLHDIAENVGEEVLRHEGFSYTLPKMDNDVKIISVSLDGTMIRIKGEGYKEAMVGAISLGDNDRTRMHTIYSGAAPETGKQHFLDNLDKELTKIKLLYPNAIVQGIADGATSNWVFLEPRTDFQLLDFFHFSEHLGNASKILFKNEQERDGWLSYWLHRVKHTNIGVSQLIEDLYSRVDKYKGNNKQVIENLLIYLENQKDRMHYWTARHNKMPIGSGVTEAACKTVIKQRLGISGARWTKEGANAIIALRTLILTKGRYDEFWKKVNFYGFRKRRANQ
jgi:hypothetical protein